MICPFYHYADEQRKIEKATLATDCKSDNVSRKAPPPQEFRRWLDGELKRSQSNTKSKLNQNGKENCSKQQSVQLNGSSKQHINNQSQDHSQQLNIPSEING